MVEGFFDKELREWKRVRSLGWIIQCGYADPEKMPANQMEWWPMAGDVMPKTPVLRKASRNKIAERIRQELGGKSE